jgi:hypothetical protein
MHRKAIIRVLKREKKREPCKPKKKPGPKRRFIKDVAAALKDVWKAGNEVCP